MSPGRKIDFPASWDRFFAARGPKQGSKPDFLIRSGPWGGQGVPEGGLIDIRGQPEKKWVPVNNCSAAVLSFRSRNLQLGSCKLQGCRALLQLGGSAEVAAQLQQQRKS